MAHLLLLTIFNCENRLESVFSRSTELLILALLVSRLRNDDTQKVPSIGAFDVWKFALRARRDWGWKRILAAKRGKM